MQVGTYPTKNFATLGPSGIRPPFIEFLNQSYIELLLINYQHRAGVRPYTYLKNLQSPVFLVNSRFLLFYDTLIGLLFPEVTEAICRVPSTLLIQRLSILYLNT